MIDLSSIQAAIGGLKVAGDIAGSMANLRDAAKMQSKVIDLQRAILEAQGGAINAQVDQSSMIDRIRTLEEEIAGMKAWNAEKDRYILNDLGDGRFTYTLKNLDDGTEPEHQLCANCFNQNQKCVLQFEQRNPGRVHYLVCHNCGAELITQGARHSDHRPAVITKRPRR